MMVLQTRSPRFLVELCSTLNHSCSCKLRTMPSMSRGNDARDCSCFDCRFYCILFMRNCYLFDASCCVMYLLCSRLSSMLLHLPLPLVLFSSCSLTLPSYEVTRASHLRFPVLGSGGSSSVVTRFRSSLLPIMRIALIDGHHFFISFIQFPATLFGTIIRCEPRKPQFSWRYAKRLIVCKVFPRPI